MYSLYLNVLRVVGGGGGGDVGVWEWVRKGDW